MKTLRAFAAIVALFTASAAFAFDLDPNEIRGKSSKEPVTVLQNRYFLKQYRPEVGFSLGMIMDEAYLDTQTYGVRSGMFFNEWLGFEVQMLKTAVSDSDDRKALNTLHYKPIDGKSGDATDANGEDITVSPDPEVNAIHSMTDFNAIAAPFYGKLNLMNKAIIYTDLYVTGGISRVETDQGDLNAMSVGVGERFYIGKAWSVRLDFRDRIFTETRAGEATRKNCYGTDLGASYFFN
jgi:outer membrane beta-barrel protein